MPGAGWQDNNLILNGIYDAIFWLVPALNGFSYSLMQTETAIPYISFCPQERHPIITPAATCVNAVTSPHFRMRVFDEHIPHKKIADPRPSEHIERLAGCTDYRFPV